MKKEVSGLLALTGICFGTLAGGAGNVSALTYSDESNIQFSFSSTLSISISDADIVIGNLIPGQDDTSNAVDVVVNTNNLYGYTLTATVGDATKDYRDLRHTNGTTNIVSIDVNSDLSTLSGQSSSVWGYTVSTNGTTWSNYNGLPKYNDTTNTAELRTTDGAAADSTTSFKIGAYAEEGQLAGDYTNVINFKVVSNGAPKLYMQDMTASQCTTTPITVYDKRDENDYIVQRLADGRCWMLDNLRLGGDVPINLTPANTNIASNFTLPASTSIFNSTVEPFLAANESDREARYDGGTTRVGVFYNYCAASGGTYCYPQGENVGNAQYDVCPKQWRMPTGGVNGEYHNLVKQFSDGSDYSEEYGYYENEDFLRALHLGLPGRYDNIRYGALSDVSYDGGQWTSSILDNEYMIAFYVSYDSVPGDIKMIFADYSYGSNADAYPIRCIMDE